MPPPKVVQAPLLHHTLGTPQNEFVLLESKDPGQIPGASPRGVPLHLHRTEDEAWYVVEGTLRFQFGAEEFDVAQGAGVLLPRGTPHTFWNPTDRAVRYVLVVGPKTAGLLAALHGPTPPPPSALKEIYRSFDVELLE